MDSILFLNSKKFIQSHFHLIYHFGYFHVFVSMRKQEFHQLDNLSSDFYCFF